MRIAGRLTSIVGLVGVVVCHGLAFLVWVLRSNLRGWAQDLLAIPDMGLEAAATITAGSSPSWAGGMTGDGADSGQLPRPVPVDPGRALDLTAAGWIAECIGRPVRCTLGVIGHSPAVTSASS